MLYQLSYAPIGFRLPQLAPLHGAKCDSSVSQSLAGPELVERSKDEKGSHQNVVSSQRGDVAQLVEHLLCM